MIHVYRALVAVGALFLLAALALIVLRANAFPPPTVPAASVTYSPGAWPSDTTPPETPGSLGEPDPALETS